MRNYCGILLLMGSLFLSGSCDSQEKIGELETFLPGKPEVLEAIKAYIMNSGTHSKVYTMGISRKSSEEAIIVLSSIVTYSELRDYLPTSYFKIGDEIILIYTGMEMIRNNDKLDKRIFKDLKTLIGNRLQADLMSDDVTLNPNFKHDMFDPHPIEIRVLKDSLVVKSVDASPLSSPSIELKYKGPN